ncbi:hypothetical protein ACIP2Z_14870 [Streptomyces iakyrus]|uniref:Uncharacterized protein n=1 Tax=Streptomyces iakyrus TaxID=68219 RepID=A0ABW8FDW4_9ACTN
MPSTVRLDSTVRRTAWATARATPTGPADTPPQASRHPAPLLPPQA